MKNLKTSNPPFLILTLHAAGKQLLAIIGLSLVSYTLVAQNASYNANSIPISGNFNSAFGAGAFNNTSTGVYNTATGLNALHYNTTGTHNTGTGVQALYNNTTGIWNTATGVNALILNTSGNYNTALGVQSLLNNTTGYNNTATGVNSLQGNRDGYNNTAVGTSALYSNYSGSLNTATGFESLYSNSSGTKNTANGYYALRANVNGIYNTASGAEALSNNSGGSFNTATGVSALIYNTTGNNNTATGTNALLSNTTGAFNTASGTNALSSNTTAYYNSAYGQTALYYNTTGAYNTATGANALANSNTGDYNTAIGYVALLNNITGSFNTALGYSAGTIGGNLFNATAIGNGAANTASNQVRIGNSAVVSIGGQVGWTTLSDGRVKKDIQEKVPGLEFINKLRPVTYHLNTDAIAAFLKTPEENRSRSDESAKEKILQTGLIAQEVEKAATDLGYDFSGVDKPKSEGDLYGLRYSEFTIPLIKSIQELSKQNEAQQQLNELLKKQNDEQQLVNESLKKELNNLRELIRKNSGTDGTININNSKVEGSLFQNAPNPFNQSTTIKYSIAANAQSAVITVVSLTGKKVKEFDLRSSSRQAVEINGGELSAGIYIYSLIVDGRLVDTKRMILTE